MVERVRAAQYLRASTEHQRYSVPSQRAALAVHALENGYDIVRTYVDDGKSGVTIAKREGLKQLLADVLAGDAPFAVVLVLDVSRWGRFQDPDQAAHYEFICREAGVRVRYCAEAFDDDGSPTASLMKGIKRVMAAEYSRQLSDRCRAGVWRRRMTGGKGGGPPPFGFVRQAFNEDGTPGPVLATGERRPRLEQVVRLTPALRDEALLIRRIFRMYVSEMRSVTNIFRTLNAEGAFRRGAPWTFTSVRCVLRNEVAIGVHAFGLTTWRFGKTTKIHPRSDWERTKVGKPIVSRALFNAAQAKLTGLKGRRSTDEEMLVWLRSLLKVHGYLTRRLIDEAPGMPRSAAYAFRFGSVVQAYRRIGYEGERRPLGRLDKAASEPDEIVRRLGRLLAEEGYLTCKLAHRCTYLPSLRVIRQRFGSLSNAFRAAGYDVSIREQLVAGQARRKARALYPRPERSPPAAS